MLAPSLEMREAKIKTSFEGKWPPDFSRLSGLGFDSVDISKSSAVARKADSRDLQGRPYFFCEIEIRKSSSALRYSYLPGSQQHSRQLRAALLFLRAMRLLPGITADLQSLCELVLPAVEFSEQAAGEPYESLLRKHELLSALQRQSQSERQRLLSNAERYASSCAALEKENGRIKARIKELESVSDKQLQELLIDWIAAHQGQFSLPRFCAAHRIPPARCEEGISCLLRQGAICEVPGKFSIQIQGAQTRQFSPAKPWPERWLQSASKLLQGPGKARP